MKVLSFLSKFTLICNFCFLLFLALQSAEARGSVGNMDKYVILRILKDVIITLGFSAFVINLLIALAYMIILVIRKNAAFLKWVPAVNLVFLVIQFYFYFFR